MDELYDFLGNNSDAIIFSSHLRKDVEKNETCVLMAQNQYGLVQYYTMRDYTLGYAMVDCPSEVCTHLNVGTYFAVDFYKTSQHVGQLIDGMKVGDYKAKVESLYESDDTIWNKRALLVLLLLGLAAG